MKNPGFSSYLRFMWYFHHLLPIEQHILLDPANPVGFRMIAFLNHPTKTIQATINMVVWIGGLGICTPDSYRNPQNSLKHGVLPQNYGW